MLIGNEGKHRAYTIPLKSYTDGKAHNPTGGVVSQSGTPQSYMNYRSQLGRSRGHSTQQCDGAWGRYQGDTHFGEHSPGNGMTVI